MRTRQAMRTAKHVQSMVLWALFVGEYCLIARSRRADASGDAAGCRETCRRSSASGRCLVPLAMSPSKDELGSSGPTESTVTWVDKSGWSRDATRHPFDADRRLGRGEAANRHPGVRIQWRRRNPYADADRRQNGRDSRRANRRIGP